MKLPDGITPQAFADAVKAMQAVVGKDRVVTDFDRGLSAYIDAYGPLPDESLLPSAAVAPDNVEQVQKILKIANDFGIPLWPISMGKNFAYGGPAPRMAGYVVLDLKRMNRILEVNEKFGYALVEPGVSYYDLYRYIKAKGHKLWIDCSAPAWGSVVGNALEHGVGYTPYGEHFMMSCGMEVVLADGTVVRTGMGALPKNNTWQLFKWGYGPYVDGLFTQSNFGVVTKLGIWLMPEPPGYKPFMVSFPREEDIAQITELLRPLKVNMIIPNAAVTTYATWEAAASVSRRQYYTGTGPMPPSAIKKMIADLDIGMWNFYGALYGPKPIIDANWGAVEAALGQVKGAKFYFEGDRKGDVAFDYRIKLMRGEPNMTEFGLMNWIGGGGHIDFSPISPTTGEDALKQFRLLEGLSHKFGFDYVGEFAVGWRDMHHIFMLLFDRADDEMKKRAMDLFAAMVDAAAAEGYGEYRTHLAFMDRVAKTYSWNDHALWRLHERIKDALDPNGILAPGKQGIWPKRLREGGRK